MDTQLQKIKDIIVRVCLGKNTVEDDVLLEKWLQEEQKHKNFFIGQILSVILFVHSMMIHYTWRLLLENMC